MIAQVVTAVLAFGSNLGDRSGTIHAALEDIRAAAGVLAVRLSPLRESIAMTLDGVDETAPRYLNGVAEVVTSLTPEQLLALVQRVELDHGRVRDTRWGDRTLDIDIVVFGGRVVQLPNLTVPHPRAHERDFVLAPWADLDPNAVLMGHGRVSQLLERIGDTTRIFPGAASSAQRDADARASAEAPVIDATPNSDRTVAP